MNYKSNYAFDKKQVLSHVNASCAVAGQRGWVANSLEALEQQVTARRIEDLVTLVIDPAVAPYGAVPFLANDKEYALFYPVAYGYEQLWWLESNPHLFKKGDWITVTKPWAECKNDRGGFAYDMGDIKINDLFQVLDITETYISAELWSATTVGKKGINEQVVYLSYSKTFALPYYAVAKTSAPVGMTAYRGFVNGNEFKQYRQDWFVDEDDFAILEVERLRELGVAVNKADLIDYNDSVARIGAETAGVVLLPTSYNGYGITFDVIGRVIPWGAFCKLYRFESTGLPAGVAFTISAD